MGKVKVNCYFCEHEALQLEYGPLIDLKINCPKCGYYQLVQEVVLFFLDKKKGELFGRDMRTREKKYLCKEQKKALSRYVQKHYSLKKGNCVPIKPDLFVDK